MSTPAVLIYGPQSCGNHLAKEIFQRLGCQGSTKDTQRFDKYPLPAPERGPIMWGHSMPSNGAWPSIASTIVKALDAGFAPHLVVPTRAQHAAIESAVDAKRAATRSDAESDYHTAVIMIAGAVAVARVTTGCTYLAYEDLTRHPAETTRWLAERIGLEWPGSAAWGFVEDDNNAKHWRQRGGA